MYYFSAKVPNVDQDSYYWNKANLLNIDQIINISFQLINIANTHSVNSQWRLNYQCYDTFIWYEICTWKDSRWEEDIQMLNLCKKVLHIQVV